VAVTVISNADGQAPRTDPTTTPDIVVQHATYGILGDPARTRNVTSIVQALAKSGQTSFPVVEIAETGDPAPDVVKTLRVRFLLNGHETVATSHDGEIFHFFTIPYKGTGWRNVAFHREPGVKIETSTSRSVVLSGRHSANRLNDGQKFRPGDNAGSLCWTSDPYHHLPVWIWVGFAGRRRINRVVLYAGEMNLQPVEFLGQISEDAGATFHDLFHINNVRFDTVTLSYALDFEPVDTDNFRLLILRSAAPETPQARWVQLSEIEVYGDDAPAAIHSVLPPPPTTSAVMPASLLETGASFSAHVHDDGQMMDIRTPWYRIQLDKHRPRIAFLAWDSLGEGNLSINLLRGVGAVPRLEQILRSVDAAADGPLRRRGNVFQYAPVGVAAGVLLRLAIKAEERSFDLELTVRTDRKIAMRGGVFRFDFAANQTPTTFVCRPGKVLNFVTIPCYLHAPDCGSAFITSNKKLTSFYRSPAGIFPALTCHVEIAPQTPHRPDRLCELETGVWQDTLHFSIEAIRPLADLTKPESRLRRLPAYALNITQWRPDTGLISNSVVSVNCGLSMLFYAEMATFSPPLKAGISAMELVRASLHRYFNGAPGYFMPPRNVYAARGEWQSSRETPAYLIICAWYVIHTIGGMQELAKSLYALECIAGEIEALDTNGDGLADHGGLPGAATSGMWFDCYNMHGADAYSNAANYRAFRCLAELELLAGRPMMAEHYRRNAERINQIYMKTFFNPSTGVLAGWRDEKGRLHDYIFPWVNGFAIYQGLVPDKQANAILDKLLAQIKRDGFKSFHFGLPTNLVPIRPADYKPGTSGCPTNASGTDTWQQYMNGGACPTFVYYVIQSFYKLGRRHDAERLLWPLVASFEKGTFNAGVQASARWPRRNPVGSAFYVWSGAYAMGEGYLPEDWQAMAAIFTGHYGIRFDNHGYSLESWSPLKGKKVKLGLPFMGQIVEAIE
jgi:hypothetical protein